MNDEMKDKKEILKELLLTEEDTLKKLKELIDKTKTLVKIDQKTNKIVVSSEFKFSNPEMILLFLVGRYFSKELSISDKEGMDIQEFEQVSGIKKTTLSKPLGGLLYSGHIGQDDEKRYFVHHYKIEEVVNARARKGLNVKTKLESFFRCISFNMLQPILLEDKPQEAYRIPSEIDAVSDGCIFE